MLGDVFIECNKMDNDKDGKAIVAQQHKVQTPNLTRESQAEKTLSSNRTASRTVNHTGNVREVAKTRTTRRHQKRPRKPQPRNKTKPRIVPMPSAFWTQMEANECMAEITTERIRVGRFAGATPLRSHAKKPQRLLIRKSGSKRSTADNKTNLENAL